MAIVIYDSQLPDFLESLKKEGLVFAPIEKDRRSFSGQYDWAVYQRGQKLAIRYGTTASSAKKFFLPFQDTLFKFEGGKLKPPKAKKAVIFGVSYEDLRGLNYLQRIFEAPVSDLVFKEKFENAIIIALDNFSPPKDLDFDIYLQEVKDGVFAAFAGSKKGKKIIEREHFQKQDIKIPNKKPPKDPILDDKDLAAAVEKSKDHPIWEELTKTCFGCGICSYVCPLCYCFETEDLVDLPDVETGKRVRQWSSCLLKNFADTNQHNFRPELKDRLYNWYYHKFVRMPREYGFPGCVDCNRCVVFCPARINYRQVLKTILDDYKKEKK